MAIFNDAERTRAYRNHPYAKVCTPVRHSSRSSRPGSTTTPRPSDSMSPRSRSSGTTARPHTLWPSPAGVQQTREYGKAASIGAPPARVQQTREYPYAKAAQPE